MNYENFSPEAKQAIEHLRKFLIKNKDKIQDRGCGCCVDYNDTYYQTNLWMVIQKSALTFNICFEEANDVADFCKSKNFWLGQK
jgi:hypothetical protein